MELGGDVIVPLVVGFPIGLVMMLAALSRMEARFVQPDERAAVVRGMLAQELTVDELEQQVADLMAQVAADRRRESARMARRHGRGQAAATLTPRVS